MNVKCIKCAVVLLFCFFSTRSAFAYDPLFVADQTTVRGNFESRYTAPCESKTLPNQVSLEDAIELALCFNPKSTEAWADVKAQTAAVGIRRAAYLPTLSATSQYLDDHSRTNIQSQSDLDSNNVDGVTSGSISMSWVLYDFGGRAAALKNANELLSVALATQSSTLQQLLEAVIKDYYNAQAAEKLLDVAHDVKRVAENSVNAASLRVEKGVSPITDELQARTTLAQDNFDYSKAGGDLQNAIGTLTSDLNYPPYTPLKIDEFSPPALSDKGFSDSAESMIKNALKNHPDILAAAGQVSAAKAKKRQIAAEGLPVFSFTAKYSRNDQPVSVSLGTPELDAVARDWYVGVQVSIPIFEGFGTIYKVNQAQAQLDSQQSILDEQKQIVSLGVWTAFHDMESALEKVKDIKIVSDVARESYDAAHHRYMSGVGNILELLSSQAALATSERQQIQAITDWRLARLHLALAMGQLGNWWNI